MSSYASGANYTASDSAAIAGGPCKAISSIASGKATVVWADGTTTIVQMNAATVYEWAVKQVKATGTDPALLVAGNFCPLF